MTSFHLSCQTHATETRSHRENDSRRAIACRKSRLPSRKAVLEFAQGRATKFDLNQFFYGNNSAEILSCDELVKLAEKSPGWQMGNAKAMLAALDRGQQLPTTYRAPVALWQFGQSLTIVAMSGEVVVDYVHEVEKALGPLNLWPMGYCNDYFGYLPSARVLQEGGYETRGLNSGLGWFSPEAQTALVAKIKDLATKAGRSAP